MKWTAWMVGLLCLVLLGCQPSQRVADKDGSLAKAKYRARIVGRSVENRPILTRVYGEGDDVILIMAGIHGTEAKGIPILDRLGEELMQRPELLEGRTVVLMPEVNPDGVKAGKRHNANDVDLNRNFPADNFSGKDKHGSEPLSQPESKIILKQIELYKPNRIVTFHEPLNCLDYDGEDAKLIAEAMGQYTDLPVKRLGGRPGSLGSYFGIDKGIPCITVELPKNAKMMSDEELWERYGQATIVSITYPEVLEAK